MRHRARFGSFVLAIGFLAAASACAPRVVLLDRQTVLEEEAAGDWPDFEARLRESTKVSDATPFPSVDQGASKKRRATMLNGEATTSAQR